MLLYLTIAQILWLSVRTSYATDLFSVLRANNATIFADAIETNRDLYEFFLSPTVRTVFAPVDSVLNSTTPKNNWIFRERGGDPVRDAAFNTADQIYGESSNSSRSNLETLSRRSGDSTPFLYTTSSDEVPANLEDGTNQKIVLIDNGVAEHKGDAEHDQSATPLRQLVTGLGNKVSVLESRIQYNGGVISLIDGLFTIPTKLSQTLATLCDTTAFGALLNSSNITASFDTQRGGTFFIPSNTAIAALGNRTLSPTAIKNHAVQNFSAYLPLLKDCQTLNAEGGAVLTVTKSHDGEYYVNGAKIISTNIILENGVAYVIDKVLAAPTIPPPWNGASYPIWKSGKITGSFAFSLLLTAFLMF